MAVTWKGGMSFAFISFDKPQTYSAGEIEWKILSLRIGVAVFLDIWGFKAFVQVRLVGSA